MGGAPELAEVRKIAHGRFWVITEGLSRRAGLIHGVDALE